MIGVENRTCALDLVSNMRKLRALNVTCADDTTNEQSISKNDELIDWFPEHLIPICHYQTSLVVTLSSTFGLVNNDRKSTTLKTVMDHYIFQIYVLMFFH